MSYNIKPNFFKDNYTPSGNPIAKQIITATLSNDGSVSITAPNSMLDFGQQGDNCVTQLQITMPSSFDVTKYDCYLMADLGSRIYKQRCGFENGRALAWIDDTLTLYASDIDCLLAIVELTPNGQNINDQSEVFISEVFYGKVQKNFLPSNWSSSVAVEVYDTVVQDTTEAVAPTKYTKTTWVNGQTPLTAANMNNIENGINEALALNNLSGSVGQILSKTSTSYEWSNAPAEIPSTGTAGHVLTKTSDGFNWQQAPTEIPSSGTNGQVLTKTNSSYEWKNIPNELPPIEPNDNDDYILSSVYQTHTTESGEDQHDRAIKWFTPTDVVQQGLPTEVDYSSYQRYLIKTEDGFAWDYPWPSPNTAGLVLVSNETGSAQWQTPTSSSSDGWTITQDWTELKLMSKTVVGLQYTSAGTECLVEVVSQTIAGGSNMMQGYSSTIPSYTATLGAPKKAMYPREIMSWHWHTTDNYHLWICLMENDTAATIKYRIKTK